MLMLNLKMPLSEAVAVSLIGIVTVMLVLAVIAGLIILVSKAIRSIEASFAGDNKSAPSVQSDVTAQAAERSEVELTDIDEKEAAVIMAIVSDKSGIPLERLRFKSIRRIDGEKKGESR